MSGKKWCVAGTASALLGWAAAAYGGEVQSLSNPVANGSIVVDGDLADWAGLTPYAPDPAEFQAEQQDWLQAWLAHDDDYIYMRFERAPGSAAFNTAAGAGYRMVIDTDEDAATGLNASGPYTISIGGEFSTNGLVDVSRWGAGGACWQLGVFPFSAVSAGPPADIELSVPRSQLLHPVTQNPATEFNIAFRGENSGDYYPDGASATDYFHYTTGAPITELPAGMVASLSNPVANGAIVIDGDVADWSGVTAYAADPAGDGGTSQDWVQVSIAHDDNNYYFRIVRTPQSVGYGSPGYWGLLDTDRDPATGIVLAGQVGAEYNFGGWNNFNSWSPAGGYTGSFGWGAVGAGGPLAVEAAIPRSTIGDPAAFNLVFLGNDSGDFYPDGAFDADYFHYTVHPPTPTGGDPVEVAVLSNRVAAGAIQIDGTFTDWASIPSFPPDAVGDGGTGQDWVRGSIAHDEENVYFLIERAPGSATFSGGLGQGYWLILDTDRSRSTGFTGYGARNFSIGGEFNWGGHATNAWDEDGCYTGGVPVVQASQAGDAEFAISRATFGNPTEFNVVFVGENSGDLYPDTAATQVFHYTTGTPLDPLPADVAASLSNPVANGAIVVNGDLSDWTAITPYPADPAGDGAGSQDWIQVWIAHDNNNFYVRMKRADGSVGWNSPGYWGAFDIDRDPTTGIKLGGTNTGAEFNTGGIVGFNAWGPSQDPPVHLGGRSFAGTAEAAGPMIEVAIARAALGNPTRFRAIYVGENSGDYYPEGGHSNETFLYTFLPCNTPFADADNDGDVDQDDFGAIQACISGENSRLVGGCECYDRDYGEQGDGDVDMDDLLKFLDCVGGPALPPAVTCGQ